MPGTLLGAIGLLFNSENKSMSWVFSSYFIDLEMGSFMHFPYEPFSVLHYIMYFIDCFSFHPDDEGDFTI